MRNLNAKTLKIVSLILKITDDLYSIATGVYICWILTRLISMTKEWLHKGWSYMKKVFI